ncbi:putative nuclease harbi1, partial [Chytriomyces hyalinus]
MSKSSASRYIWQITAVINTRLKPAFVSMPKTTQEWNQCKQIMFDRAQFPDAYLAIDGSLFEIERPYDFEGYYCRNFYPALNAQIVVDASMMIRDFDIRLGSHNDKQIFRSSTFGKRIHQWLPANGLIVGDSGYTFFTHVMIPYPIHEN